MRTTTVDLRMPEVHSDDGTRAEVKTTDFADLEHEGELPFNLVCVNAPELPQFVAEAGRDRFRDRYTIGVWAWETDAIPASWDSAFALVDEIWVYSRYVADLLSHSAPCPVVRVPLPIEIPQPSGDDIGFALGGDAFTFLFLFDFWSTLQRKNPLGLVRAFIRAFEPNEGPRLLLKSFNGDYKPDRLAQLRAAAGGRDDIVVVDRFVTDQQRVNLINRCDAYVSLHRSEGFGLDAGRGDGARQAGDRHGLRRQRRLHDARELVARRLRGDARRPRGRDYPAHGTWAEPDVDHAAELMRRVWEEREEASARAERGRMDVAQHFSLDAVGEMARTQAATAQRVVAPAGRGARRVRAVARSAALLRGDRGGEGDVRRHEGRGADRRREGRGAAGAADGDAAVHVPPGRAQRLRGQRAARARHAAARPGRRHAGGAAPAGRAGQAVRPRLRAVGLRVGERRRGRADARGRPGPPRLDPPRDLLPRRVRAPRAGLPRRPPGRHRLPRLRGHLPRRRAGPPPGAGALREDVRRVRLGARPRLRSRRAARRAARRGDPGQGRRPRPDDGRALPGEGPRRRAGRRRHGAARLRGRRRSRPCSRRRSSST